MVADTEHQYELTARPSLNKDPLTHTVESPHYLQPG